MNRKTGLDNIKSESE